MPYSERISVRQKDRLVEIMNENYLSLQGRHANGTSMVSRREEWCKITAELNSIGPAKSESEWRSCWRNLKCKTKTKPGVSGSSLHRILDDTIISIVSREIESRPKTTPTNTDMAAIRKSKTESNRKLADSNEGHPLSYGAAKPSSEQPVTKSLSPIPCKPETAIHPSISQTLEEPSSLSTKCRSQRMNQDQKAYIVKSFDANAEMFKYDEFWAKMATILNDLGPPKSTVAWKKAWQVMKSKAIYRCTHIQNSDCTSDELDLSIFRISTKYEEEEAQRKNRRFETVLSPETKSNRVKCAEVLRTIQGGYLFSCDYCSALIDAFDELIVHLNEHLKESVNYDENSSSASSSASIQSLCETNISTDNKLIHHHRIKPTNDPTMSCKNFAKLTSFKEPLENIHEPKVLHIDTDMPIKEEEELLSFENDVSTCDPLFGAIKTEIEEHGYGGGESTMDTSIHNDIDRDPTHEKTFSTLLPNLECDTIEDVDRDSIPSPSSSKFKCTKCAPELSFDTEEELSFYCNHAITKCPYVHCKKSFQCKNSLGRHIAINHIESQCGQCLRKFASITLLERHEFTHDKKLECDICHKFFGIKTSIRSHMISHSATKRFKCLDCGECFKYNKAYNDHKKMHMGVEREKRFVCEHCGKAYAYKFILKEHLKTHSEMREHLCKICGKAFHSSKYLMVHTQRLHTDDRPWTCRYCPTSFRNSDTRKRHEIKIHSKH